jgi:transposase, IS6 family
MRTRHVRPDPIARSALAGFCFPSDVIVLAVRWYLRFGLSHRDVEELLTERGSQADHVTVYRWVLRFTPLLADAARPCRRAVGDRWQLVQNLRRGYYELVVAEPANRRVAVAVEELALVT